MRRMSERAMSQRFVGLLVLVLSSLCSVVVGHDHDGSGSTEDLRDFLDRMSTNSTSMNDPRLQFSDTNMCEILLMQHMSESPPTPIPFECICEQCKGTIGAKGERGDRGLQGMLGSRGSDGMPGSIGPRGFRGSQGLKGNKGDIGESGPNGPAGPPGREGAQGTKGEKGDNGPVGPKGTTGIQGHTGSCPDTCESARGPPGEQGPPGSAGARGLPGVKGDIGPKGFNGDKGDLGEPGNPGERGLKGDMGEQGLCECSDGADGVKGGPGPKGDKGEKGPIGISGTQGLMGPKGIDGQDGPMGPVGPCSPTTQSAFSASATDPFPLPNWPIAFENVHTNEQNHFNPGFGVYTAPVNGTYVFSYDLAVSVTSLKVGLYHNFVPVVRTTEDISDTPARQTTASHNLVLHLIEDDWVWLQVKNFDSNGIYADSDRSSTFSGYLLYPDSCLPFFGRDSPPSASFGNQTYTWDGPGATAASP